MPTEVDTRITPSLHVGNVHAIEGYDESTGPYVASCATALDTAYQGLAAIHDAKAAAEKNPTLTPEGRLLMVSKFADKKMDLMTRAFDIAMSNLSKGINDLSSMLSAPLTQAANAPVVSGEVRAHCKAMSAEQRGVFLAELRASRDYTSLSAILGAPGFLSNLSDEMREVHVRLYHEARHPAEAKRLKVMQAAKDILDSRSGLIFSEIEKAVGAPRAKVNHLRDVTRRAEEAFAK